MLPTNIWGLILYQSLSQQYSTIHSNLTKNKANNNEILQGQFHRN